MAKILLVEDEENLCTLYRMELEQEGHEVIVAHDGKAGVELAGRHKPDLVIMDISLPHKMDGLESMSRILSEDRSVPVIVNTGYSQYRDNFMTWAAEAYLVKSADLTPLKETIRNVLNKRQRQGPRRPPGPGIAGDPAK